MEFAIAKLIHFFGLSIWLAIIPVEGLLAHRLLRTSGSRERYELLRFEDMFSYRTELPALGLAVVGGLWLTWLHGVENLFAQDWYTTKLAIIGYLVVAESLVILGRARIAKSLERAWANNCEVGPEVERWYKALVALGGGALLGVLFVLLLAVFRHLPIAGVITALVFTGVIGLVLLPGVNRTLWASDTPLLRQEEVEQ